MPAVWGRGRDAAARMTDTEPAEPDADTGLAPTGLAAPIEATEAVTAWSLDDDYDETPTPRFTPRRITALGITASLIVIAAAAGVTVWVLREQATHGHATSIDSVAKAGASGTYREPPPPPPPPAPVTVTQTVRAAPTPIEIREPETAPAAQSGPSPLSPQALAVFDDRFITNLQAVGWIVWNPPLMTQSAHRVCAAINQGVAPDVLRQQLIDSETVTAYEAGSFISAAMNTYPYCP